MGCGASWPQVRVACKAAFAGLCHSRSSIPSAETSCARSNATSRLIRVAGEQAKLGMWALGTRRDYMANKGTDLRTMQDFLGHRNPKHTVHYTRVAGSRFEGCGNGEGSPWRPHAKRALCMSVARGARDHPTHLRCVKRWLLMIHHDICRSPLFRSPHSGLR